MSVLFLSCEHGGNEVPKHLRQCFAGQEAVLETHRGLDIGARDLFRHIAPLAEESTETTLSRLCIEMNRSEGHRQLFSRFTKGLPEAEKAELLGLHRTYWGGFTERIKERITGGSGVIHVAVHSFTPVLDGVRRSLDIGLLYDPSREVEKAFCLTWRKAIRSRMPALTVRMNQPYKGTSDGFPTALRRQFSQHYAGIELEVNQRFAAHGRMDKKLSTVLHGSLSEAMAAAK